MKNRIVGNPQDLFQRLEADLSIYKGEAIHATTLANQALKENKALVKRIEKMETRMHGLIHHNADE